MWEAACVPWALPSSASHHAAEWDPLWGIS